MSEATADAPVPIRPRRPRTRAGASVAPLGTINPFADRVERRRVVAVQLNGPQDDAFAALRERSGAKSDSDLIKIALAVYYEREFGA